MTEPDTPIRVLFVCLGNICRSPLAEGLFIDLAGRRGVLDRFEIDSCGLGGWHVGEKPDPRTIAVAQKHGIELPSLARRFDPSSDPDRYDLILAMDAANRKGLLDAGCEPAKVRMMRSFDPTAGGDADVPDPYFGGEDGFDEVYAMLDRACVGLLDHLLDR